MIPFVAAVARFLTRVAAVFLLAMMLINVVDVGLRISVNAPIFGTYEIVEFLLAAVAFETSAPNGVLPAVPTKP